MPKLHQGRVDTEAEILQAHSPGMPASEAEQFARVHVQEERDVGATKEQEERLGPALEKGVARCYSTEK